MNRRVLPAVAVLLMIFPIVLPAQDMIAVTGTVLDAETGKPIPGASVYIKQGKRGTYTFRDGSFRLPLPSGSHTLTVSSIGYTPVTRTISTDSTVYTFSLEVSPILSKGVTVTAGLSGEQIVRRAIKRRDVYRENLETFQGLLYSKFVLDIEGNAFGQLDDADRMVLLETFSESYYDREKGYRIEVVQRRQTANVPSSQNLFALANFVSFYDETLPLLNVEVPTPMNEGTLSRYNFTIESRTALGDHGVYIIKVEPNTSVLPAFSGTMEILEGTFDLLEVDLAPSEATAITFVRGLTFRQKFQEFADDVWQPTFLEVRGNAEVVILQGIAGIRPDFRITTIYTESEANQPIPDSVFADEEIFTAAEDADSAKAEFWENNTLSELSEREKRMYEEVDSLVAVADSAIQSEFSWDVGPYIDYNRVGSLSIGGTGTVGYGPVSLEAFGGYSFGQEIPLGSLELSGVILRERTHSLRVSGKTFSVLSTTAQDREYYPRFFNTVTAALFHRDYYDYARTDGWSGTVSGRYDLLNGSFEFEQSRQFQVDTVTGWSLIKDEPYRHNPAILEGKFDVMRGSLTWGNPDAFLIISSGAGFDLDLKIGGLTGKESTMGTEFEAVEGTVLVDLPVIPTGYNPMMLNLGFYAGTGSDNLPTQYQFRLPTSVTVLGRFGVFRSAPTGLYGGTEFLAAHGSFNFTDFIWRWVGLPTYEGRGIEVAVAGSAGRFRQENSAGYLPTGDEWYTEIGFGVGKIPIFISNVIYLGFDARWGIGSLGSGNFGATLGLSSPF